MQNRYSVVSIGEPVIDFVEVAEKGRLIFKCNAGGGAANVVSCAASIGGRPAMLGRVGNDMFGEYLIEELSKKFDTAGIKKDSFKQTGIGFVRNKENGEREFLFYRSDAEAVLYDDNSDREIIENCCIYHFTSVSMVAEAIARDTLKARDYARKCNALVSFDINYRPTICEDRNKVRELILDAANSSDIVKMSLEELDEFYPGMTKESCAQMLISKGVSLVCITLGAEGCYYATSGGGAYVRAPEVKAIDTTGCGDAFVGSLLQLLTENNLHLRLKGIAPGELRESVHMAVCAASLCAERQGSFECMPTREEIKEMLEKEKNITGLLSFGVRGVKAEAFLAIYFALTDMTR